MLDYLNMIDVLLVHPPIKEYSKNRIALYRGSVQKDPPLGLCYIGTMLKKNNFKVKILDMDLLKLNYNEFSNYIRVLKPKIVGIGANTITFPIALKLAKLVKEFNNEIKIIFGGVHPTLFPNDVIKESNIDIVVIGEGEYVTLELAQFFLENKGKMEDIAGIIYKTSTNKIQINKQRDVIRNLDNLPFPERDLIIGGKNLDYYSLVAMQNPIAPIITSRGCPFNCIFCSKLHHNPIVRFRSTENIISELQIIREKEKIIDISIRDDTFNLKPNRNIELCNKIVKEKVDIYWRAMLRPELITIPLVESYKKSNCYLVLIGAESGSNPMLKFLRKGYNADQIKAGFNIVNKYQIETHANFIMGIPGETKFDIQKTIEMIKYIKPTYLQISILTALPGTDLYDYLSSNNILNSPRNLSDYIGFLYPSYKNPNINPAELQRWRKNVLMSYYVSYNFFIKFQHLILNNMKRFWNNSVNYMKNSFV